MAPASAALTSIMTESAHGRREAMGCGSLASSPPNRSLDLATSFRQAHPRADQPNACRSPKRQFGDIQRHVCAPTNPGNRRCGREKLDVPQVRSRGYPAEKRAIVLATTNFSLQRAEIAERLSAQEYIDYSALHSQGALIGSAKYAPKPSFNMNDSSSPFDNWIRA
jgi:hypothetical protein